MRVNEWKPVSTWLHKFFCNQKSTAMFQVFCGFALGVLLSPWSKGLFWLAIITFLNEIFIYMFTNGDPRYYNLFVRTAVIYANILGYICGRTLAQTEITLCNIPCLCEDCEQMCPLLHPQSLPTTQSKSR